MTQTYPLDAVIRTVTANTKPAPPSERFVIIDVDQRRAVPKKRFLHEARYFIVTNTSEGRRGVECKVPPIDLKDFEKDRAVRILVSYLASCPPGNEERVAEALFDGPHPAAVFNEKIRKWLHDFAGQQTHDFIENYYDKKIDLQAYIKRKAREETGLDLQVKLSVQGEDQLKPVALDPVQFAIRVKDYDKEQVLKVKGSLQVDEHSKINAIYYAPGKTSLADMVKGQIQRYFAENVTLQSLHTELNYSVKQDLIDHLNRKLKAAGRKVEYLSLESVLEKDVKDIGAGFFETKLDIKCDIQEYPQPIIVTTAVQMGLQNLARYRGSGSPPLDSWVKEKLERVIHELLFDVRYIDILLNFPPLEREIKRVLSNEAEGIGYSIKQLITVPDLEPLTWLKPFTRVIESEFETKLPRFNVKLRLAVTAKLNSLEDIRSYLNRRQNVPELMDEKIRDDVQQLLHTVDPERFYIRFSFTDGDEISVEEELKKRIRKLLKAEFNAEVISVTPKIVDTEFTERLIKLQQEVRQFQAQIFLPDSEAIVPVSFVGNFKVESVDADGWHKFQLLRYTLDDIQQYLENNIAAELGSFFKSLQAGRNDEGFTDVEDSIKKLSERSIREVYGIVIRVFAVRRLHNELEHVETETQKIRILGAHQAERERIENLSELITKMEGILINIIENNGTEQEVEEQKRKIAKLRSELSQGLIPPMKNLRKQVQAKVSGSKSLYSATGPKSLTAGEDQPRENNDDPEQD